MRVLNVNMSIDPVGGGGTAERTYQMCRSLIKAGADCSLLTTDIGCTPERRSSLAGVRILALPCRMRRYYIPKLSLKTVADAVSEADIVHIMNHWTFLGVQVYWLARRFRKPYVVCPAGALRIFGRSKAIKRVFNLAVGRDIIRNAAGWIAITADEREQFRPYGVDVDRISVIPNGINPEDFAVTDDCGIRQRHGLGHHPFILFVGRLNEIKGPDLLLEAFCGLRDAVSPYHLVFAGPDQGLGTEMRSMAKNAGIEERVHFIDYLGTVEKSWAYHAAALLVIPSRHESMSIVALEAGISGTPVLLTERCGFNEIAAVDGGMVVPASVKGITQGLLSMCQDTARLRLMGSRLRQLVQECYTWDSIIQQHLALYKKILTSLPKPS